MLSGLNILLKNYFVFTKVVNSYLMLLGCKSVWGFLCKNGHHYQFIALIIRLVTTVQCTRNILYLTDSEPDCLPDSNSDMDPDLAIGLYSKCYRKQKHIL